MNGTNILDLKDVLFEMRQKGDSLFQLQASYYAPLDNWVNSPSFPTYSYTCDLSQKQA
ncbi:MAG: hypothetical protein QM485_14055 [Flavobacteriaceae bacterium]